MYSLTLTADERRAFDWVGTRYNSRQGRRPLARLHPRGPRVGRRRRHHVHIPEHVAWEINELAEEEDYAWACFAPALAAQAE